MLKIDIHTHILPPEIPSFKRKFGYGGFIELEKLGGCKARMKYDDGRFFRDIDDNCYDPQTRLKDCDKLGVSVQVLSTVPVMFSYWARPQDAFDVARFLNDHVASVVSQNPKRFIGLGTLPLQDPERSILEVVRAKQLGLAGFQIGSHVNQWNLSDPNLFTVFAEIEKQGMSLFIHPWDMMGQDRMPKYWLPWLVGMPAEVALAACSLMFGGVLQRLPNLRVALAHGGGALAATVGRIEQGFLTRPDLCAVDCNVNPRQQIQRFWVDSLVHDPKALSFCLETFGNEKVVLGSDYPFPLGEHEPGQNISALKLSKPVEAQLFSENALNWLALKKEKLQ